MGVLSGSRARGGGSDLKIDHIPYGISLFDAGPRREYTTAYDLTPFHWLSGPEILFNNTRFAATRWLTTPYPKCLVLLPYPTNGRENWWFSLRCMQELLYLCEKSD